MQTSRIISTLFLALSFILTGCPDTTNYPLAESTEALPFDKNLTGTWTTTNEDAVAEKVQIKKGKSADLYKLFVLEEGSLYGTDTKEFDAWLIAFEGKKFLVLQEAGKDGDESNFYLHAIEYSEKNLTIYDIKLKSGKNATITSVKAYQAEIKASMKMKDYLIEKVEWTKK